MTAVPVAGVGYVLNSLTQQWEAPGRTPLPAVVATDRSELVSGTYIPGLTPDTVGVRSAIELVDVEAGPDGIIRLDPGDYHGLRLWGQVRPSGPGVVRLFDCRTPGMDPRRLVGPDQFGAVHNTETDRFVEMYDCTALGSDWHTIRGVTVPITLTSTGETILATQSPFSAGLRGRNITAMRCEIADFQDLVAILGSGWHLLQNWIHRGWYAKGGVGTSADGQTHTDVIQIYFTDVGAPANEIRGNMLGGARNSDGYTGVAPGGNLGEDCANSALMGQLEILGRAVDMVVDDNWIAGGAASINLNYKNGNDLSGLAVTNNRFLRWTPSGIPVRNDPGVAYIYTKTTLHPTLTGNVLWDWDGPITGSGEPVPITTVSV